MIAWQKITRLNFHKIRNFIYIQACDRPNFKKPERKHTYIYDVHTNGVLGKGERLLKLDTCLQILFFLNNKSIVYCADGGTGVWFVGHFWWTSKMRDLKDNNIKKSKYLEPARVQYSWNFIFYHMFADSIISNNRSIIHFSGW